MASSLPSYSVKQERSTRRGQGLVWKKGVPTVATEGVHSAPPALLLAPRSEGDLRLSHARTKRASVKPFVPDWAILDKKVLRFRGYVTETVEGAAAEAKARLTAAEEEEGGAIASPQICRVRPITLLYFLVDNTLNVTEESPIEKTLGRTKPQLVARQRVPRPDGSGFWHWTDLNLGVSLSLYGRDFHLCDCDAFTREYLLSEGTEVNPPAAVPCDPLEDLRASRADTPHRVSDLRPRPPPPTLGGPRTPERILRFEIEVEEKIVTGRIEQRPAVLLYRPHNQTVELREPADKEFAEVRRFGPVILRPTKVPLEGYGRSHVAEVGEEDVGFPVLTARAFIPPVVIRIFGRRITILSCDETTGEYLQQQFGAKNVPIMRRPDTLVTEDITPGVGRTQSDIVTRNTPAPGILPSQDPTVLRFLAKLDTDDRVDRERRFIVYLHLSDSSIEVLEKGTGQGGPAACGRAITRCQVPKPPSGEDDDRPARSFYGVKDFYIGCPLWIRGRGYLVIDADLAVLKFAESYPERVPPRLLASLRSHFGRTQSKVAEEAEAALALTEAPRGEGNKGDQGGERAEA
ncbi:EF-hand domain-containing protein 1-like [Oratosquilla oratoria]|uniref:EF-hand domain-containing protein 1-like n=1 Tax=Oratosquilla oratoria TaxID=337810 RepID=UPI003F76F26B